MAKVDFYILSSGDPDESLRVACRVAEKAWRQGNRVRIESDSMDSLRRLDRLMWSFKQESFLPHEMEADTQALERFQREARTASSLNHPHICTIYAVDEHEGQHFIAMELLEGETLKHSISGRPMETDMVLRLGIEVADALHPGVGDHRH